MIIYYKEVPKAAIDYKVHQWGNRQDNWRNKSYDERAASLHHIAGQLRNQTDQLSRLITLEIDDLLAQNHPEIAPG